MRRRTAAHAATPRCSEFTESGQPPATVFQAQLVHSQMDTSTPLRLCIALSPAAKRHLGRAGLDGQVTCGIRRFDLREVEVAVGAPHAQRMLALRPTASMFQPELTHGGSTLVVDVHRKHLPLSAAFGGAEFVFVVHIPAVSEIVVSRSFHTTSKQPRAAPGFNKSPAKRIRGLPSRTFVPGPPCVAEAAMNAALLEHAAPAATCSRGVAAIAAPAPPRAEGRARPFLPLEDIVQDWAQEAACGEFVDLIQPDISDCCLPAGEDGCQWV